MVKFMNTLRIITFLILLLSSVPMLKHHFAGNKPEHDLLIHLHVLFGLIFIIVTVINMIMNRKARNVKDK